MAWGPFVGRKQAAFTPSWGRRIVGMEGLRAIAAVTVLVGHVKTHLNHDVDWGIFQFPMHFVLNGLTLFFALSGFLLFRPFATSLLTGERFPALGRYAANRALRIFPVYIVILLLVSLVLGLAYVTPQGDAQTESADMVGYMTNPWLLLMNSTMLQTFFPFSIKTGLGVAWSLTVELVFYVVMPLLAIASLWLRRKVNGRNSMLIALTPAIVIFIIGMVGKTYHKIVFASIPADERFINLWGGTWNAVVSLSFFSHADLFVFGMVAAILVASFETGRISHIYASRARWIAAIVAVGAALAARGAPSFTEDTAWALVCGAVIFFVAMPNKSAQPGVLSKVLDFGPIRYVGLISYSLYLWHVPVIWLVLRLGIVGPETPLGLLANIGIVLAISIGFASVTYFLVEKPALSLKKRTDLRRAGNT
jgi:peptidoglycan/LPS O-acetylase OafA/YrhL